jgi:hypothetical protein
VIRRDPSCAGDQVRQVTEVSQQVGGPCPAESAAVMHAALHSDHKPGSSPAAGQHTGLGGRDHGDVPHLAGTQPEDRGEHQIGLLKAPGHVVCAQDQIRPCPPGQPFHDEAERGPGQA